MFGEHIVVRCHSNHTMCTGGCVDVESNHDLILEAGQETYVNGGNADRFMNSAPSTSTHRTPNIRLLPAQRSPRQHTTTADIFR